MNVYTRKPERAQMLKVLMDDFICFLLFDSHKM